MWVHPLTEMREMRYIVYASNSSTCTTAATLVLVLVHGAAPLTFKGAFKAERDGGRWTDKEEEGLGEKGGGSRKRGRGRMGGSE